MASIFKTLIICTLLVSFGIFVSTDRGFFTSSQAYITKYESKKADIESKKNSVKSTLSSVSMKLEETNQLANSLKEQAAKVQKDIDTTNDAITQTKLIINQLQDQIQSNQRDLDELIEQMKALIFEIQKANQITPLESILSSSTLGEALSKVYNLTSLQDKADTLRIKVIKAKEELERNKLSSEDSQRQLEGAKGLLASQKSSLDDLLQKTQNDEEKYRLYAKNLNDQAGELENQIAQVEREKSADAEKYRLEEEQKRIAAEAAARSSYSGGNGSLLVPRGGTINRGGGGACFFEDGSNPGIPGGFFGSPSDGYLVREFDDCVHDGIDIANGLGTEIHAVADGVIVRRSYAGNGYGNYTIIKHTLPNGRHVYSLYAHMRSVPLYGIGSSVNKGDTVGYMGSTGRSTGSHLHFTLFSDSYEVSLNDGCLYGGWSHSFCYRPSRFISL
jgi:murein DD-endopeptidase MepM/ murein hydrolase activator NlpD